MEQCLVQPGQENLIIVPFLACTLIGAAIKCSIPTGQRPSRNQPIVHDLRPKKQQQVVWIVFDELEQRLGLEQSRTPLPAFKSLHDESFCATNAYPPADLTMLSLPALIEGRRLADAKLSASGDLRWQTARKIPFESWRRMPSLFSRADLDGFNCAIVGGTTHTIGCLEITYASPILSHFPPILSLKGKHCFKPSFGNCLTRFARFPGALPTQTLIGVCFAKRSRWFAEPTSI